MHKTHIQMAKEVYMYQQSTVLRGLRRTWSLTLALTATTLVTACNAAGHPDRTPLAVLATTPAAGAASVPNDTVIRATFNRAVDPSRLAQSFTLACPNGTTLSGSVSYDASTRTATFTPGARLLSDEVCTARISTAVGSALL